ncbi:hypothetical protein ADN00_08640 [Ornatilinea apprima]|uniref:DNA repair protein RecN n=1 Tax=Ornatilinea apprima TaxID=1134406 RepID=A0A0P6Y7P0_9CHLR|nr:DNA repair protein RecN [Ornatilinea apprima]KPL77653.1 hypothetical protein ADN00_08640 [Ornatilinea apprima]
MLLELRIENFAIIQSLELRFQGGLIAFTGETGAGKSIILDAVEALMGGRPDTTFVRSGAERASVEALFSIPEQTRAEVLAILEREDLLDDPNEILISREIRLEGRNTARVNGRSVSVGLLRELGEYLVDIHGQSEHLSLLNVRQHLRLLDRYAAADSLLEAYRAPYRQLQALRRQLKDLRAGERDAHQRAEFLTFQIQEIESARLKPGEEEELRQERSRLANAEKLAALAQQSVAALDEGTPEMPSISDLLGQVVESLASLSRIDSSQAELHERAASLEEITADIAIELRDYLEQIEFNPRRLEQVEVRLDLINGLKRKYGGSEEAVLAFAERARADLEQITHAGERIAELEAEEAALLPRLAEHARALSEARREAAKTLARGIERELNDLSMVGARFQVDFQTLPDEKGLPLPGKGSLAYDENGVDRVEFLIAPNQGEGFKPLVKIASGGETSRLMLALKNVLASADHVPTLVFDEIDQGIGGRVGTVVGEKLWRLGRSHQVLCITHLPQLAAFGDQHYHVRKQVSSGRTHTQVEALHGESRQEELALMLGGSSDANRQAAREALQYVSRRTREITA